MKFSVACLLEDTRNIDHVFQYVATSHTRLLYHLVIYDSFYCSLVKTLSCFLNHLLTIAITLFYPYFFIGCIIFTNRIGSQEPIASESLKNSSTGSEIIVRIIYKICNNFFSRNSSLCICLLLLSTSNVNFTVYSTVLYNRFIDIYLFRIYLYTVTYIKMRGISIQLATNRNVIRLVIYQRGQWPPDIYSSDSSQFLLILGT